jgi:dUTP pyrophosphatase
MEMKVVLDAGAIMPTRAHELDAGYDLYSPAGKYLFPNVKGVDNSIVIDTGVHVQIPEGYVGDIKSKSGMMVNYSIITDGTVDAGYTGSIRVKLFNLGSSLYHIEKGQKIAQLVLKKIITPELVQVDKLEETERGSGGFGSSGKF